MYEDISYCGAGKFVSHGEWAHPDRVINSSEVIFVIDGTVHINEEGREYHLKKDDLFLLEPNVRHFGCKESSNTSFFWMHFTGKQGILLSPKHQHINESYNLSLLFKQLLHYQSENQSEECLNYLARLILIEGFSPSKQSSANKQVAEISAWISANRDAALTVESIAGHFGYNPDYISRLFKTHCGKPLKEYIIGSKINFIKQLLLTSELSLAEIAVCTGFGDYKYFLKFFKYHEGITPTQFLRAYPKTHINHR